MVLEVHVRPSTCLHCVVTSTVCSASEVSVKDKNAMNGISVLKTDVSVDNGATSL